MCFVLFSEGQCFLFPVKWPRTAVTIDMLNRKQNQFLVQHNCTRTSVKKEACPVSWMKLKTLLLQIPIRLCWSLIGLHWNTYCLVWNHCFAKDRLEMWLQVFFHMCGHGHLLISVKISRGPLSQTAQQTSTPISLRYAHHKLRLMNQTTPVLLSHYSFHS